MKKIFIVTIIFILIFFISLITLFFLDNKETLTFLKNENVSIISNSTESLKESDSRLNVVKEEKNCLTSSEDENSDCSVDLSKTENLEKIKEEENEVSEEIKKNEGENLENLENLAPDFNLAQLNGEKIRLSDYRSNKPVIVEFWNSWCHNCQREMPKLEKIYEKYDGKFEIIGVNLLANDDSENQVKNFIEKYKITFPIVLDKKLSAAKKYDIKATNTHFLINTDGTIYDSFFVDLDEEKLKEFLKFNKVEIGK